MALIYIIILFTPALIVLLISSDYLKDVSFLSYFFTDSSFINFSEHQLNKFSPLVQINSNAYFNWKYDFFADLICKSLNLGFNYYLSLLLLISSAGFYFLIPLLNPNQTTNKLTNCILISFLQVSFLFIFGLDTILLSLICWFPWVFLFWIFLNKTSNIGIYFLCISIISAAYFSLNQLSLVTSLLFLFIIITSFDNINKNIYLLFLPIFIIIPLFVCFYIPAVNFPDYPSNAHLVPFYGIADGLQTNIGNQPKFLSADRETIRARYLLPATALLIGLFVIRFNIWKRNILLQPKMFFSLFNISLILYIFILLDSYLFSPFINQLSPLASISRMIPSLFYLPMAHIALCLILMLYFCALFFINNLKYSIISCSFFLLPLISLDIKRGVLHPILANRNFTELSKFVNKSSKEDLKKIFISPSLYLLRKEGSDEIGLQSSIKSEFIPLSSFQFEIFSSKNQDDLKNTFDKNESTRWSENTGKQTGHEWILVRLNNAELIKGIKIKTGKFSADFPKGVEISYREDCSTSFFNFEDFSSIYKEDNYQGEIQISPAGYPYYIEQYNFSRIFSNPITGRCLLIKQIASNKNFDWSVAEIELLK